MRPRTGLDALESRKILFAWTFTPFPSFLVSTWCGVWFFFVAQKPKLGLGRLTAEVSRSRTIRETETHTHAVGFL